jgi:Flp pilus assembly protein TadG
MALRRASGTASSENGQAVVVIVLFLAVLLGMAAIVLDVGSWYLVSRRAQAAADAGATAAAQQLPSDPGAAAAYGKSYVDKNLSGAGATVTTNYLGDPLQARVDVKL